MRRPHAILDNAPRVPATHAATSRRASSLATLALAATALVVLAAFGTACSSAGHMASPYGNTSGTEAWTEAVADLESGEHALAMRAAKWLSRHPSPGAIDALIASVENGETWPDVAATCCTALGVLGDASRTGPVLLAAATSEAADARALSSVRAAASLSVSVRGDDDAPDRDPFRAIVAAFGWSEDAESAAGTAAARHEAVSVLASYARAEATAWLAGALDRDPDADVRRHAAVALGSRQSADAVAPLIVAAQSDPSTRVRAAAESALSMFHEEDVLAARRLTDAVLRARGEVAASERAIHYRGVERRLARQSPPVPEGQMLEWVQAASEYVGAWIESITLVADHAPPGHPLGYNDSANGGELCEYRILLNNASTQRRLSSSAFAYTYDPYVTVINRELYIPQVDPGQSTELASTLLVLVSPDIPEQHTARLYLETGDSFLNAYNRDMPVYRPFTLRFTSPGVGPVRFEVLPIDDDDWGRSDGDGDGMAEWGERLEITVDAFNLGAEAIDEATLRLYSLSSLVYVVTSTSRPMTLPADEAPSFRAEFDVVLPAGYAGDHTLYFKAALTKTQAKNVFLWEQEFSLAIGASTLSAAGPVHTYDPFDLDDLLDVFVRRQEHTVDQTYFLDKLNQKFLDARDTISSD